MSRVIVAAAGSGSGKTLITCGLLQALKKKNVDIRAYKCGPDYIDPMFHREILGVPSDNLDTFFLDENMVQALLAKEQGVSIIEGVMGLYDGLGGVRAEGSAYDLAKKTHTPVVLILDAYGMGRTLVAVLKGILLEDKEKLIKGVILNRISEHYYHTIAPIMEEETKVLVLGFLPKLKDLCIESRHLGLKLPSEIDNLKEQVEVLSKELEKHVDLEEFLAIADRVESLNPAEEVSRMKEELRLAVAQDEAFCFYYQENFRVLESLGVKIVYFSPIHDKELPENIDGIYFGGGYPELCLPELSANESMKNSIRLALEKGIPSIAECGGFMYLHKSILDRNGKNYEMVGAINGSCYNTGKLCRFGYVMLSVHGCEIRGHEFHYYDSNACGEDFTATKPTTLKSWNYGYGNKQRIWGYPHLYFRSGMELTKKYVSWMHEYHEKK